MSGTTTQLYAMHQRIENVGQKKRHGKGDEHIAQISQGRDGAPEKAGGQRHAHDPVKGIRRLVENHRPSRGLAERNAQKAPATLADSRVGIALEVPDSYP